MAFIKKRLGPLKLKYGGLFASASIRAVACTWRVRFIGREYVDNLSEKGKPFVLVFWHGDMLMGWYYHRNREYSSLVSMSKDGDLLSEVLRRWNYTVIRGSSSRGGKDARTLMEEIIRSGKVLVVTPDGPRGPRYEMKMGAVRVAQKTGVPLISVTFNVKQAIYLKSWDKFTVPLPFTKIIVKYNAPETINPFLNGESLDEYRDKLQEKIKPGIVGV